MYNKAFLIGNLTRDPELRYTPSGIPVTRFSIAVNRIKRKDSGGEAPSNQQGVSRDGSYQDVDFINIVAWRRLAEICGEFLKKGRPVAIEGRLQIRSYVAKNGEKRTMTEVIADNMQMLGRKGDADRTPSANQLAGGEPSAADSDTGSGGAKNSGEEIPF